MSTFYIRHGRIRRRFDTRPVGEVLADRWWSGWFWGAVLGIAALALAIIVYQEVVK